jgi:YegS/Rv2252/BmrU family lipid kinase
MMKKYIFIVNPIAGGGRAKKFIPSIQARCAKEQVSCQIIQTTRPKEALNIASQFRNSDSTIVAVGGDGTTNEVMSGLIGSDVIFGILPFGSGNDIASSFRIHPHNALDILFQNNSKKFDVATVNENYFLGVASCGFDTEVNRTANRIPRVIKGSTLYVLSIFLTLIKFQAPMLTIELPDKIIQKEIMLLAVGHGDRYGGGMLITPNASREDGLFDLCLVEKVSKFELIKLIPKVFKGLHITHPKVTYLKVPMLKIIGKGTVYADGEFKTELPAMYGFAQKAIRLLVPESIPGF